MAKKLVVGKLVVVGSRALVIGTWLQPTTYKTLSCFIITMTMTMTMMVNPSCSVKILIGSNHIITLKLVTPIMFSKLELPTHKLYTEDCQKCLNICSWFLHLNQLSARKVRSGDRRIQSPSIANQAPPHQKFTSVHQP